MGQLLHLNNTLGGANHQSSTHCLCVEISWVQGLSLQCRWVVRAASVPEYIVGRMDVMAIAIQMHGPWRLACSHLEMGRCENQ